MSLKSKFKALTTAYKSACANSRNAWENTDCSISESVKESTKIKFALWAKDKTELASGYQSSGYAGSGFYSYGVKIHD